MSTVSKSTIRRYNGTDWDYIYLTTVADIVTMGSQVTLAPGTTPFADAEVIQANSNVKALLTRVMNRLVYIDGTRFPAVENGSAITALSGSVINSGTVGLAYLPRNVKGDTIEVASEAEKAALTSSDVAIGDLVKVTGGKVYSVKAIDGSGNITYVELSDSASQIAWSRITGVPTEVGTGEGQLNLTNVVKTTDLVETASVANEGKAVKINSAGKLDTSITGDAATLGGNAPSYFATQSAMTALEGRVDTAEGDITQLKDDVTNASTITKGLLPLSVIPKAALERLVVVADDTARFALTTDDVQKGDTVKVNSTSKMYFVVDETKLNIEDGYEIYVAGAAASVEWSGVLHTPTTLSGYGITDAVNTSDTTTTAVANKLLYLDSNGKLPASITGDAATLESHNAAYFATAQSVSDINDIIGAATDPANGTLRKRLNTIEGQIGAVGNSGTILDDINGLQTLMGTAPAGYSSDVMTDLAGLKAGTAITALSADKLTGSHNLSRAVLPENIGGATHQVTDIAQAYTTLPNNAYNGDLVLTSAGVLYVVIDETKLNIADGYLKLVDIAANTIAWDKVTSVPTTATRDTTYASKDKMILDNVLLTSDASTTATANKLLYLNADGKLPASITGDADTLDSYHANHFATAADMTTVKNQIGDAATAGTILYRLGGAETDIGNLQTQVNSMSLNTLIQAAAVTDITGAEEGQLALVNAEV